MSSPQALFFYGTLRHRPLLDLVLGPAGAARMRLTPARLPGHLARWVEGECFPLIRAEDGAAEGVLAEGFLPEDIARLEYYEGGFLYGLSPMTVEARGRRVEARVFFPEEGAWAVGAPFELGDWEARWGAITLNAAADYMAGYGRFSAAEQVRRFPRMRARAWSRVMAEDAPATAAVRVGPGAETVDVLRRRRKHEGFFALDEVALTHPAFAGGRMEVLREVFVGTDAALVLPYDPVHDRVVLIEQFRAGPWLRGDRKPWVLEPVAGLVDPGETPEETARREAVEEAGLHLRQLVPAPGGYASPGATTEHFHLFVGLCDIDPAMEALGGLDAEGEDIRTHVMSLDAALGLIGTGEINVVPLQALLYWAALNRHSLRALA
ncbi:MAG: NUDIX domain-containing protein [Rhodobacteraceae bacterium]|jgi:nudix-type nucleoside diphosphatase (YffH/AdpP family)|nr:NUDIX domain-containing protein [Paracoccaceae bacterium]